MYKLMIILAGILSSLVWMFFILTAISANMPGVAVINCFGLIISAILGLMFLEGGTL